MTMTIGMSLCMNVLLNIFFRFLDTLTLFYGTGGKHANASPDGKRLPPPNNKEALACSLFTCM